MPAVVGNIMLMSWQKGTQINIQCSLIWELTFYGFKLVYKATEEPKNISWAKGEDKVKHSTEPRWFKKFCTCCKDLDNQARSGRFKILNAKAILQEIQVNPVAPREYQASLTSHTTVLFVTLTSSAKYPK